MMDYQFENLLRNVLAYGEDRGPQKGAQRRSLWAPFPLAFDLSNDKVPLITSRRVNWKRATKELMWQLRGETIVEKIGHPLAEAIWGRYANEAGDIGPAFGAQYRNAGGSFELFHKVTDTHYDVGSAGVDQLANVIHHLHKTPDTRSAIISLWSPSELDFSDVEPNVTTMQFSLRGSNYDQLNLQVYQRAANLSMLVPEEIYQAGLLAHLVARELNIRGAGASPAKLTWVMGDAYIPTPRIKLALDQVDQHAHTPQPMTAKVTIDPFPSLRLLTNTLEAGHIRVTNYFPLPDPRDIDEAAK